MNYLVHLVLAQAFPFGAAHRGNESKSASDAALTPIGAAATAPSPPAKILRALRDKAQGDIPSLFPLVSSDAEIARHRVPLTVIAGSCDKCGEAGFSPVSAALSAQAYRHSDPAEKGNSR